MNAKNSMHAVRLVSVLGLSLLAALTYAQSDPIAVPDQYLVAPAHPYSDNVMTNDINATGATAVLAKQSAHGTVQLKTDGSFTYTPTTSYIGQDTFQYL